MHFKDEKVESDTLSTSKICACEFKHKLDAQS